MDRLLDLSLLHLKRLGLKGNEFLHEALLRRGYPALHERGALWMPRGPHREDCAYLQQFVEVIPVEDHRRYSARLELGPRDAWDVARRILSIPQHTGFIGLPRPTRNPWGQYVKMHHGHATTVGPCYHHGGLDLGIALLVKTSPLMGVRTCNSCSGHGDRERQAFLSFTLPWDAAWGRAVLDSLAVPMPNTRFEWSDEYDSVQFNPLGGLTDRGLLSFLNDLQRLGRRLLDAT